MKWEDEGRSEKRRGGEPKRLSWSSGRKRRRNGVVLITRSMYAEISKGGGFERATSFGGARKKTTPNEGDLFRGGLGERRPRRTKDAPCSNGGSSLTRWGRALERKNKGPPPLPSSTTEAEDRDRNGGKDGARYQREENEGEKKKRLFYLDRAGDEIINGETRNKKTGREA